MALQLERYKNCPLVNRQTTVGAS